MDFMKGKGAQINVPNVYASTLVSTEDVDGLDEELLLNQPATEVFYETPKKIISRNESPDINLYSSINPYQGCEHGCVYCYARNSHQYWGFSAGLDFESKIIVKRDAPRLLEKEFLKSSYKPSTVMLSGNTDCYQPLEKKYQITRRLLEMFLKYRHPVGIITKNALVLRDIDLLKELAKHDLVMVVLSITSENKSLRRLLEPRTACASKKFEAIRKLTEAGIPVGIMNAPIIPGLNHHETPAILKRASEAGAVFASYTVVRLNGQIGKIFKDWLIKTYPDRADKVWNQIQELHGGKVNDSEFGRRIKGDGKLAESIKNLFDVSKRKYFKNMEPPRLSTAHFRKLGNYSLF